MVEHGVTFVFTVLIWWLGTGIILVLCAQPRRTFGRSLLGASFVLVAALYGLFISARSAGASAHYLSFLSAIGIWGWLEMSFLMGFIMGPQRQAYLGVRGGWRHFRQATRAIIHNELAILGTAALLALLTWQTPNPVALWTFLVLWSMRLSAKLNLFFGVPNTGEQFLPPHLAYLKTYFNKRRMNLLFPVSILGSTIALVVLVQKLLMAEGGFQITGLALVSALLALAILEHWFMVLPLPTDKLWQWGLRGTAPQASRTPDGLDAPRIVKAP